MVKYELGKMYFKGKGCLINIEESMKYFKNAIEHNCMQAMYKYWLIIKNEFKEEGIKYIKMAADKGYLPATYDYYLILEKESKFQNHNKDPINYLKKNC